MSHGTHDTTRRCGVCQPARSGATDLNQDVPERLRTIHPSTVSASDDEHGPAARVLLIPTRNAVMRRFLCGDLSEKEPFHLTEPGQQYDAIGCCSALVLTEYRRKGIVSHLTLQAIASICRDHPLQSLFVWPFSPEGDQCAKQRALQVKRPLHKRRDHEGKSHAANDGGSLPN